MDTPILSALTVMNWHINFIQQQQTKVIFTMWSTVSCKLMWCFSLRNCSCGRTPASNFVSRKNCKVQIWTRSMPHFPKKYHYIYHYTLITNWLIKPSFDEVEGGSGPEVVGLHTSSTTRLENCAPCANLKRSRQQIQKHLVRKFKHGSTHLLAITETNCIEMAGSGKNTITYMI